MIGHFLAFGVLAFIEKRCHCQTGFRCRPFNVLHHDVHRSKRVACPLQRDKTEQPMLDRVPLGGAGRVVADRNGDAVVSGDGMVQAVFPKARPVAIAASAVTQQQDFLHAGIGGPAEFRNPGVQAVHCKLWGVGGEANDDRAAIPNGFVEPVGRSDGGCMTPEIVLVDVFRLSTPGASWVSEVADEFLLFRVQAQDGIAGILKSFLEVGDQFELSVAVRMLRFGDALAVDPKRIFLALQQLADRIGAEAHSLGAHFLADGSRVFPAPPRTAHRIASRVRFHQFIQKCQHVVFF